MSYNCETHFDPVTILHEALTETASIASATLPDFQQACSGTMDGMFAVIRTTGLVLL